MSWLYLTLVSAMSLGLADAFSKRYFADATSLSLLVVRFSFPALLMLPVFLGIDVLAIDKAVWPLMAVLVPLELLAMWLYVIAIRDAPLHLTLPYLAFTPVFIILTGYVLLGEVIHLRGVAGILLIVVGTYLLNLDKKKLEKNLFAPFVAIVKIRGSRLMLLVAAIYSVTAVVGKQALQYLNPELFGFFYFTILGSSAFVVVILLQPKVIWQLTIRPWRMVLVGLLMAVMAVTHFMAIARIEAAYMVSVKRTSVLFGMLAGAWLFRDMNFRQHLPAAVIMLMGVFVISV